MAETKVVSSPVVQPLVSPSSPILPTASLSKSISSLASTGAARWNDIEGQKWVLQITAKEALSGNYCGRDPFMPSLKWLVTATTSSATSASTPNVDGTTSVDLVLKPFEEESWRSDSGKLLEWTARIRSIRASNRAFPLSLPIYPVHDTSSTLATWNGLHLGKDDRIQIHIHYLPYRVASLVDPDHEYRQAATASS